jgi:hypothetical protein
MYPLVKVIVGVGVLVFVGVRLGTFELDVLVGVEV